MTRRQMETHAALLEAEEIFHKKIRKKAVIHIKEYVFADTKKSKENKDNMVKTWSK